MAATRIRGKGFSEEEEQFVIQSIKGGQLSGREIGEKLGRSEASIFTFTWLLRKAGKLPATGRKRAKTHVEEGEAEMEIQPAPEPMPDPKTCAHFRLSGNERIQQIFPAFFETYNLADLWQTWEVCIKCGDVRKITHYNPHTGVENPLPEPASWPQIYVPQDVRAMAATLAFQAPPGRIANPADVHRIILWPKVAPATAAVPLPVVAYSPPPTAAVPLVATGYEVTQNAAAYVDPYEISAIVNEIVAMDRDLPRADAEIEGLDWGSWDNIISAAKDESHPHHKRAVRLVEQSVGMPAMLDEHREEESLPDVPADHHVSVELPSGLIAHVDPAVIGTAEGEDLFALLDRVGEAVVKQFGHEPEGALVPGEDLVTEPLLYAQAIALDTSKELDSMEDLLDDLRARHMEQTELIVELRDKLRTVEDRAREVIEADQVGWKAMLAERDERIAKLQEQLALAECVIYVGWGIAKGIAADARAVVARLEGYGR